LIRHIFCRYDTVNFKYYMSTINAGY